MGLPKKVEDLIRHEIRNIPEKEKKLILVWSKEVEQIKADKSLSLQQQIVKVHNLETSPIVRVFIGRISKLARKHLWQERNWASRLTLMGLTLGLTIAGTQGAGVAALGGAVGLKLYMLSSAGGALLGVFIDEVEKNLKK
jgi:phosphoglycerate dehydrogenase-like enzyme